MTPHPLFMVARAGHPLAGRSALSLSDYFEYPLAALTRLPPRILEPFRAAQRQSANPAALFRNFPAIECNVLPVVKELVLGTDAIMATTLPSIHDDLESGQLALLGSEPWMLTRYAIVTLRNQQLSAASARFREFILEAETTMSTDEARLLARWAPAASSR